jgi:alpha-beta hydrolase superfamily lysophospholipase
VTDSETGTAVTADGISLRTLRWPSTGDPWARVVIAHGLGEHAGRYDHVARRMADAGIEVLAHDHRGFGASGGARAYVDRWSRFHDDLRAQVNAARSRRRDLPLVLYGHSMGGLMALGYVLDGHPAPDLLVLSVPGLDLTIAAWKRRAAPVVGRVLPRLRLGNDLPPGGLSRDPAVEERVANDPLCQSTSTTHLGSEGFAEMRRVRAALEAGARLPVPTYVFHGGADPYVTPDASGILERDPCVTRRVYPGLRHEPHNEPEWRSVVDDTIAWIREHAPTPG